MGMHSSIWANKGMRDVEWPELGRCQVGVVCYVLEMRKRQRIYHSMARFQRSYV